MPFNLCFDLNVQYYTSMFFSLHFDTKFIRIIYKYGKYMAIYNRNVPKLHVFDI